MANKDNISPTYGTLTALMMDFVKNDSVALYIIPSAGKSEKSAAVDRFNYPVKRFELHNYDYLSLEFNKELHGRQSTEGSPCSNLGEETYYEA